MKRIKLHLCAPLQSYGYKDYFNIRKTKMNPTKTAVAGIIACCGGIPRKSPLIKDIVDSISIESERVYEPYQEEEKTTVFIPDILCDFQIAKGTEENPIYQANGKIYKNSVVIKKYYIEDAYFIVYVTAEDKKIDEYVNWLINPVWVPYLGRKCCVPTMPIYMGEVECLFQD